MGQGCNSCTRSPGLPSYPPETPQPLTTPVREVGQGPRSRVNGEPGSQKREMEGPGWKTSRCCISLHDLHVHVTPRGGVNGSVSATRFQKQVLSLQRLPKAGELSPTFAIHVIKYPIQTQPRSTFLQERPALTHTPFLQTPRSPHVATRIPALPAPDVRGGL